MSNKVLLIDDEITAKTKLGKKIKKIVTEAGFELLFAQTWKDDGFHPRASDLIRTDAHICLVLLDIMFPKQRFEGGAIFKEIKKLKPDLPVIILTQMDKYTEAEEFLERGAKDYIVKTTFEKRSSKLLNYLKSLSQNPGNDDLTLILEKQTENVYYLDIQDEKGYTVLKQRRKLTRPLLTIILEAYSKEERIASFPEPGKGGCVKGLEPWDRLTIQKEVWKFNRSIRDSSRGRVHSLLKGMGIHGASAFKLVIGNIKTTED